MKTIQTFYEIDILFPMKCYERDCYKCLDYITHVIGHEGKNSLLSYLLREQLCSALVAGYYHRLSAFSYVHLTLTLTEKGVQEYERALEAVFAMIRLLQTEPLPKHAFEEYSNKGKLDWDFIQKNNPLDFCTKYSNLMQSYKQSEMHEIVKD